MEGNQNLTKTQGYFIIVLLAGLLVVSGLHAFLSLASITWATAAETATILPDEVEPKLTATVTMPDAVEVGEEFDLLVKASNPHNEPVDLENIDFEPSFIRGFEVVSVTPSAVENVGYLSYQRWRISKTVEPGKSLTVTFRMKAMRIGRFDSDIGICNPNEDCTTHLAIIRVNEKTASD